MLATYSNPTLVRSIARKLHLPPILPSTRKTKKYMLQHGNRWIHFGQMGYQDFTKHRDLARRTRFRHRNRSWAKAPKYSAAWLAYHVLW
jgi:hypothetical protein